MATEKKIISLTVKVGLLLFAVCIVAPVLLMMLFRYTVPLQTLRLLFSAGSTSSVVWEEEKMDSANERALLCECDMSSLRSDVCELKGDVQVIPSNVIIIALVHPSVSVRRRSWRMKPHARKNDGHALAGVTEVLVSVTPSSPHVPGCMAESAAPAVVFSVGGYAGNMFHDFTDVLIPLLITTSRFRSDVHMLVSNAPPWWLDKYRPLLRGLSRHAVIGMDRQSAEVLCYPHVVVGPSVHKEMSIDTAKTVGGHYSMADFARLARRSYGLERDTAIRLLHGSDNIKSPRRPRLLIISRKITRMFTNMGAVAQAAAMLGYEVLVSETEQRSDLSAFARLVNSCDVLVGMHGAGRTNLVFLPPGAVVVQVVPLGRLEAMAREDFRVPAGNMGLGYVHYGIAVTTGIFLYAGCLALR